jgi:hypothetical protein
MAVFPNRSSNSGLVAWLRVPVALIRVSTVYAPFFEKERDEEQRSRRYRLLFLFPAEAVTGTTDRGMYT